MHRTWIRVEDEYGQFDLPKGAVLDKGVTPVKGYPEHVGQFARDGKPKTSKGAPQGDVEIPEGEPNDTWKVGQIDAFAAANDIDLADASNKADKLAAIAAAGTQTPDDQSGTGKTNDAGEPGKESE